MKINLYPEPQKDEWYGPINTCPVCGIETIWSGFNYCPNCGEKIEWIDNYEEYEKKLDKI